MSTNEHEQKVRVALEQARALLWPHHVYEGSAATLQRPSLGWNNMAALSLIIRDMDTLIGNLSDQGCSSAQEEK